MSVTFLHTADWQLGKPFASVRDESKRNRLQHERLQAVRRMAAVAKANGCDFVLVAGDIFDSSQATKATVSAACAAIGSLGIPLYAIPGNHDHGGPGSIWEQEFFKREKDQLAPNLHVLLEPRPLVLDHAVILPAPLLRRHEAADPTAWIRSACDASLPADRPWIVLAHGTIQGFGSVQDDEDGESGVANRIDLARLPEEITYVALGDWHGTKQVGPNAWYSGTPEIDRFPKGEGNEPGHLLQVTLAAGSPPAVEKISSGRLAWKDLTFRFSGDDSLDTLAQRLEEIAGQHAEDHLLLLTLEGSLGIAAAARLEQILESCESRLLRLKLDHRVQVAPSDEEITALTCRESDPLVTTVAAALVSRIDRGAEDADIARLALRELHAALS